MEKLGFKRHRYPADVIRHAVWLYYRFTLSLRDVEELLAERGIEVSCERGRCSGSGQPLPPQRFLATYASVYNSFYTARHLISRATLRILRGEAAGAWSAAVAAA